MKTEIKARKPMTKKLISRYSKFRVPATSSLVDNTTLITGIDAVVRLSSMPGKKPIIAGKTTTIFRGVIMLCASLKVFAYTAIGIIKPAKKNSKRN